MMNIIENPDQKQWESLVQRPAIDSEKLNSIVKNIIAKVRDNGDQALIEYAKKFDNVELNELEVTPLEVDIAIAQVTDDLKNAIQLAYDNITKFHQSQILKEEKVETMPGVTCWRKSLPIEKVGLYIPGGTAPLFSTILMLGIPAKIAGCKEIIICTPPGKDGRVHPAVLFTANLVGVKKIYKVGGAQAVAAMAQGTETIPKVFKIFGPGNQYVTKAKEMIQQSGVAIDMPAGPSEVLVIADQTANPVFVAADLLSQAEHGVDSQVVLLSDNLSVIKKTMTEIENQLKHLPRKDMAIGALKNSKAICFDYVETCFQFSNLYAPEHLIIASDSANNYLDHITNAGSVFIGNYSCESAGDYASGTNHTLPTNGYAKNYSGVSLDSFVKKVTFQEITPSGIQNIGPAIEIMAAAEELQAHKNAVTVRLNSLTK